MEPGAERLYEYTAAEIVGRTLAALVPPDHPDELPGILDRVRRGEHIEHFETVRVRKDGGRVDVSLTISPIRNSEDRVVGASKIARDITARKEEDRRKTEFLALLAHELRNPLAPLRNALQVMRLAGDDRASAERTQAMMERQLQHLIRLVDDLLDVSRISQGKLQLRRERLSLSAVVGGALDVCRQVVEQHGHQLTVALPDEPVEVDADRTRLAQVVCNLLTNAAKYSEPGNRIWLTARREEDEAVVVVRDEGIGIPPPMLTRVFEMFTQVDRSLEKSHGGLGVGLGIVKRLVEMHGGAVEARSEGEGRGSEFVVRLPVAGPAVGTHQPPDQRAGEATPPGPRRILVVDDNEDSADSLGQLLELLGHEVRTAYDGEAGVTEAGAFRPHVVLMDIGMPRLNGYDAARRIRGQPWGKQVVLVALTGWGQEGDRRRSREVGFDAHLVKPVEPAALDKLLAESQATTG
ncbi:MAG TPA: ATP-binding protein [Gemmataceae bacterium]|nr:ATP-binding protein [Gemmataceae bacterium]